MGAIFLRNSDPMILSTVMPFCLRHTWNGICVPCEGMLRYYSLLLARAYSQRLERPGGRGNSDAALPQGRASLHSIMGFEW